MNANTITAIAEAKKGETLVKTWGNDGWSNVTGDQKRAIENQCESQYNTQAEVNACVARKLSALGGGSGSGSTGGGINLTNLGTSAQQFLSGFMAGKNQGDTNVYTNTNYEPPKSKTGTYVLIGLGVVALGVGIWYFGFKKK